MNIASTLRYLAPALCLTYGLASATAVEPRLRLGPNEVTAEAAVLNRYVRDGVTRVDDPILHASGSIRLMNIGLNIDTYTALETDNGTRVETGEIDEVRARVDYIYDVLNLGMVQLLPYYETSVYPAKGNPRTFNGIQADTALDRKRWTREAHWLGVDGWYKLPWSGLEVGAGLAYDLNDSAGWKGAIAARQFVQVGTLDIALYEKINFGDNRYRDYNIGLNRNGLTTAEAGVTLTMPLPLEMLYVSVTGAGHIWLDSKSRDVMDRKATFVAGVSVSLRLSQLGL